MLLASCGEPAVTRSLSLTECRLPKVAQAVQCGELQVPENRAHPEGRKLSIFVAVLPANTLSPKPDPLVLLGEATGRRMAVTPRILPGANGPAPCVRSNASSRSVIGDHGHRSTEAGWED